jgi:hypothetical protein
MQVIARNAWSGLVGLLGLTSMMFMNIAATKTTLTATLGLCGKLTPVPR